MSKPWLIDNFKTYFYTNSTLVNDGKGSKIQIVSCKEKIMLPQIMR